MSTTRGRGMKVWECKIGSREGVPLVSPADPPMREAIARAYREITGQEAGFVFSGWGSSLTEEELAVVEHRDPATLHPCPFCGAEATKPCRGPAGEDALDICGARMDLVAPRSAAAEDREWWDQANARANFRARSTD